MTEREILVGLMSANNTLFNLLIRALHDHGIVDKDELRQSLLDSVRGSREKPKMSEMRRYDWVQYEQLADLLAKKDLEPPWRPTVIQGGKPDPKS